MENREEKNNSLKSRISGGEDGKQEVMEMVLCQSYPLIQAETDAFDHSKSQA